MLTALNLITQHHWSPTGQDSVSEYRRCAISHAAGAFLLRLHDQPTNGR
jgi:hypothetical protein